MIMLELSAFDSFNVVWKISIVGLITFYIHEMIWNALPFKRDGFNELPLRSLIKTVSWRTYSFLIIAFLTWFFSKSSGSESILYSAVLNVLQLIFHYIHERVWNKIKWGRK